jgi:hypothetical protein
LFGIQTGFNGYTVQSLVPIIGEVGLRAAGTDYPSWVTSRYLALPDEIPSRVKDLSLQLTASQPTPYDRARAIENYLRDYPYTLDVSRPALSQDLVDYFLFDLRKGYCDYYASAMVVLARMAGIPARLAVGYASGTYNLNSNLFQVTQADAHSWPEVYFPNIGWVPFEPTAARPAFNRPVIPTPEATPNPSFPIPIKYPARSNPARTVGIAGLILITLAGSGWAGFDELRLRRMQPQSAAVEIYRRLKRYGKTLHIAIEPGQTPYEFAESMGITISGFHTHTETSNTGSSVTQGIQSVARLVVRLVFRPSEPQHANKIRLLSEWRALRWRLRWAWVLQGWTNIQVWAHRLFGRLFPNGNEPTNRQEVPVTNLIEQ